MPDCSKVWKSCLRILSLNPRGLPFPSAVVFYCVLWSKGLKALVQWSLASPALCLSTAFQTAPSNYQTRSKTPSTLLLPMLSGCALGIRRRALYIMNTFYLWITTAMLIVLGTLYLFIYIMCLFPGEAFFQSSHYLGALILSLTCCPKAIFWVVCEHHPRQCSLVPAFWAHWSPLLCISSHYYAMIICLHCLRS